MTEQPPAEVTAIHTRLLKCALEVDESRAYWRHVDPEAPEPRARRAFAEYWFGARSMARVEVLITNFRARFDSFPEALYALRRWSNMAPDTRALICHWHLQLSDPMYRAFTGTYLTERRDALRAEIRRDLVVAWVGQQGPGRWTMATRIQLASKLMSSAYAAGLVGGRRDPRPLRFPRVEDLALGYLMYLLRGVRIAGTLLENPYLASVGLTGAALDQRLRNLPDLGFRRMGELFDMSWRYPSLVLWADAQLIPDYQSNKPGALTSELS